MEIVKTVIPQASLITVNVIQYDSYYSHRSVVAVKRTVSQDWSMLYVFGQLNEKCYIVKRVDGKVLHSDRMSHDQFIRVTGKISTYVASNTSGMSNFLLQDNEISQ